MAIDQRTRMRMLGMIGFVALTSGCAGRTADVRRMESQIGMLDERLSQLERGSITITPSEPFPAALPAAPASAVAQPSATEALEDRLWTKPTPYDVQQALKNAGFYTGSVDGKPGPLTRSAIREFQRVQGLKMDGIVGKRTWEQLSPYLEGNVASTLSVPK
jgi:murein L,D-transpeptidase YcbB/YkuD